MSAPTVTNGARVTQTFTLANGDIAQNVMHYHASASITESDALNFIDSIIAGWELNLKAQMPSSTHLYDVTVADMTVAPYIEYFKQPDEAATGSTAALPAQCAAVLSLHTGIGGRRGRGRIYVPSLLQAALDSAGNLTSTYQGHVKDWFDSIDVLVAGSTTYTIQVYSRLANLMHPVTTRTMDNRVDIQRRRANRRLP